MLRTQPTRTAFSAPWFEACSEGRLLIQHCETCGHYQFYPRVFCTNCGGAQPAWVEASGNGRIASFTIVRRPVSSAYEAPYVVALVTLEEGPRMMSNIVDCDTHTLRIGDQLTVSFERWSDEVSLPVFTAVLTNASGEVHPSQEEAEE